MMMQSVIKLVQGVGRLEQEQVRTEEQHSSPPVKLQKNNICGLKLCYRNSFTKHMSCCDLFVSVSFLLVRFLLRSSDMSANDFRR